MSVITFNKVNKSYGNVEVLKNFDLKIKENKITVLVGPSGSGKSTVLNLIGLLDKPTSGEITLFGAPIPNPFSRSASKLLRNNIGYLFQNFALVDQKSVAYNLKIALEHVRGNKHRMIQSALQKVELDGFQKKKIYQCSGGEQQRIAVARLLLKPCELVLCDEPTGSLDDDNKHIIFDLLKELKDMGKTVVIVTHDEELVEIADYVVEIG